jgi:hypothetical protein
MAKLVGAFKGKILKIYAIALILPIMLPAISIAIALSSWALGYVTLYH